MFNLYENLVRLCAIKGVSPSKMCLDIGKSKSLMSALRTGKTVGISQDSAEKMAEYFGVTVDEVLHGIREPEPKEIKKDPTDEQIGEIKDEIMERIKLLTPVERLALDQFLDLLEAKRELGKVQNK